MARLRCQDMNCNSDFPQLDIKVCVKCSKYYCFFHNDMHDCQKPNLSKGEAEHLNVDRLTRIRQTAKKLTICYKNELVNEIDMLTQEFIKIDRELEGFIILVQSKENYIELLKNEILEFDHRAASKYSIKLRQEIQSELKQHYRCLCNSGSDSKNTISNPKNSHLDLPNHLDSVTSMKNGIQGLSLTKASKNPSSEDSQFTEIYNELKIKRKIEELSEYFNLNLELFKYFRSCKLSKLETIFLAIIESANRYINDSKIYENYLSKLDSYFPSGIKGVLNLKNKEGLNNPDSLSTIRELLRASKLSDVSKFKELAGIYIYDFRGHENSRLQVYTDLDCLFDIFIILKGDSFHILMPEKKYYKFIKNLWVQSSFKKKF